MSVPDMRACVQYAMTYPARRPACIPPLDLFTLRTVDLYALEVSGHRFGKNAVTVVLFMDLLG